MYSSESYWSLAYCKFTACVSVSAFASLVAIQIGITSSAIRLKICAIISGIKKYKSITKKKLKKHDKIVLLISKVLIASDISHDEFVLIDKVLKEFYDAKEEIKNSNDK